MAKKRKNQSTQKIVKIVEASNVALPYEVATNKSNTNDTISKTKRNENIGSHLCKCHTKTKSSNQRPGTWESITKMYGNADTTEVWDGKGKNPERFFKRKMGYKRKRKLKQQSERNNDDKNDTITPKSKHPKKHKSAIKRSVISFYHKKNKRKRGFGSKDPKLHGNKQNNDYNVDDVKVAPPIIRFKVNRKPYKSFNQHNGTGDSCVGGPCTRDLNNYKQQKQNDTAVLEDKKITSSNKNVTRKMKTKGQIPKNNIEKGYTISKSSSEKVKDFLSKCSVFKFFCKRSYSQKLHNIVDKSKGEPMFEMKVDSVNMRVLNTSEINDNVKKFGKRERNRSCICPSRINSLKKGKHNVCAKGICERALTNNRTRFDCKCKGKNNVIVCKDSNCNSKDFKYYKKRKKCKLFKSPKYKGLNKPPLEVILDRTNMNILNSYEIGNMLREASNYEICPTGICNDADKDPDTELKCRCIGKKIIPVTTECTDETCARTMKNRNLSDICSRFFCKSDYRFETDRKKVHEYKKRPIKHKHKKQDTERRNIKTKSDTNNKRLFSNAPQLTRKGEWCETFSECNIERTKRINKKSKKEKRKPTKRRKEEQIENQLRKILKSPKNIVHPENNFKQYIIKCLKRKRKRCEKKLKEKEKEFKNREKKTTKENLKMQKNLEKHNKIEEPHWNCLTKFISGILNIGINLIKEIITMAFSLITNPIGSYVYIRERAKDPPGTIKKMSDWLFRIWSNKTTKVSQTVKESDTMNVIADQIEDLAVYDAIFANKGKTKAERSLYERKKRMRKKRIMKRHDEALFGCRHMLLTTMRKTPCLWFYYICPDLYPQCLSLVSFMTNFFHIIIYLVAFICWTPCIVSFELCRAFLCCFFCTG